MEIVPIIFEQTLWDDFPYVSKSEVESKKNKENLIPSILRDFLLILKKLLNCDKVLNAVILFLLNEKEIISYSEKMIRGSKISQKLLHLCLYPAIRCLVYFLQYNSKLMEFEVNFAI